MTGSSKLYDAMHSWQDWSFGRWMPQLWLR